MQKKLIGNDMISITYPSPSLRRTLAFVAHVALLIACAAVLVLILIALQ